MLNFPHGRLPKVHIDGRCPKCGASLVGELHFNNKIIVKCKNPFCNYKDSYELDVIDGYKE